MAGCSQLCLSSNQIAGFFDHQYLCKESIGIIDFLQVDNYQGTVALQNTTLSIQMVGFSEHQYPWKESINILDFLCEENNQGKLASNTTTCGWVGSIVSFVQSDCCTL